VPDKNLVWIVWRERVGTIPIAGLRGCVAVCTSALVRIQKIFLSYNLTEKIVKAYVGRQ
jgi:hypothetical protein